MSGIWLTVYIGIASCIFAAILVIGLFIEDMMHTHKINSMNRKGKRK